MALDAEFKHHLHELMVETSDALRDELNEHRRLLVWKAQQTHNRAAMPSAYSKAAIHAFRTRVEATIDKYLDALDECGIRVNDSVEREMLQEIRSLTTAVPSLHMPPGAKAQNLPAVSGSHARELVRVGNALYRKAANRLREAKMKARPNSQVAANPTAAAPSAGASLFLAGDAPTVLISYSWDSDEHKEWVLQLAERLRMKGGVNVVLDRWHLQPGMDRTHFMEQGVANSNFVLIVCTPNYAMKANSRDGGVGYEAMIITSQLAHQIRQNKFIPVLRLGDWNSSAPIWIQSKVGVDFSGDPYDEKQYDLLLKTLHQALPSAPPIGPKPAFEYTDVPRSRDLTANAVKVILDQPELGPIAYAFYETKGEAARRIQTYVRPIDARGESFRFSTSTGESLTGTKVQVAQRYIACNLELREQGFTRMTNFDGSGTGMFNLP
jgi:hypothetical protein